MNDGFRLFDGQDPSKKVKFILSKIGSGITRTFTFSDKDGTIALKENFIGGAGLIYVDRGDVSPYDFCISDLIHDDTWRVLNLSHILPDGAVLVEFSVRFKSPIENKRIMFEAYSYVNSVNIRYMVNPVANKYESRDIRLPVDSNKAIKYYSNVTGVMDIVVTGWWSGTILV